MSRPAAFAFAAVCLLASPTLAAPAAHAPSSDSVASPAAAATPAAIANTGGGDKLDHLGRIAAQIDTLQADLERRTEAIRNSRVRALRRRDTARLDAVQRRLDKTRASFQTVAADVDIAHLRDMPKIEERDLLAELRELTAPVLDAFRRMSARPRRIESLRADIATLQERLDRAHRAHIIVVHLIDARPGGTISVELVRTRVAIERVIEDLELEAAEKRRSLDRDLSTDTSMVDAATGAITDFLATKGRNMLLSLITFLLVALSLMYLRRRVLPVGRMRQGRFAWLRKPLSALYGALVVIAASVASLLCLYLLHDMLLFTVAILVLSFGAWSTRRMLPHVLREVRLMLNLGSVREGERIIWRGLPWNVAKLGIRPELENPELQGGRIKIRAAMILDDVSRPMHKDEPWFPTSAGDWVLLHGDLWGRVSLQTPEQVLVAVSGHQLRRYGVQDYLDAQPTNLSRGFLKRIVLPASADLLSRLPEARTELADRLGHRLGPALGVADHSLLQIAVQPLPPTPVALQLEVRVTCDGALGGLWRRLTYETVSIWLELCAERGWKVPAQARLLDLAADLGADADAGGSPTSA